MRNTTDNSVAECNLGAALLEAGRRDEAMAHFRRALDIDPDYREAHVDLGNALLDAGQADEARSTTVRSWRSTPVTPTPPLGLGNALLAAGRTDDAILAYRQAVNSAPDLALAHNNLGNALLRSGQVEEAAEQYRSALAVDASFALAHNNLGNALMRTPDGTDEAIRHYRTRSRARSRLCGGALQPRHRAVSGWPRGRSDRATTARRWRSGPHAEAHNNLGVAHLREGRVDEAIVEYRSALENDPQPAAALDNLARALATHPDAQARRPAEAVALAERAAQLTDGRSPESLRTPRARVRGERSLRRCGSAPASAPSRWPGQGETMRWWDSSRQTRPATCAPGP